MTFGGPVGSRERQGAAIIEEAIVKEATTPTGVTGAIGAGSFAKHAPLTADSPYGNASPQGPRPPSLPTNSTFRASEFQFGFAGPNGPSRPVNAAPNAASATTPSAKPAKDKSAAGPMDAKAQAIINYMASVLTDTEEDFTADQKNAKLAKILNDPGVTVTISDVALDYLYSMGVKPDLVLRAVSPAKKLALDIYRAVHENPLAPKISREALAMLFVRQFINEKQVFTSNKSSAPRRLIEDALAQLKQSSKGDEKIGEALGTAKAVLKEMEDAEPLARSLRNGITDPNSTAAGKAVSLAKIVKPGGPPARLGYALLQLTQPEINDDLAPALKLLKPEDAPFVMQAFADAIKSFDGPVHDFWEQFIFAHAPKEPQTFEQAFEQSLTIAQMATKKYLAAPDRQQRKTEFKSASEEWFIIQSMMKQAYRVAATNSNPKKAAASATTPSAKSAKDKSAAVPADAIDELNAKLDAKYQSMFSDKGALAEAYNLTRADARKVLNETPAEQKYQIGLYDAQGKVRDAHIKLQTTTLQATASQNEYLNYLKISANYTTAKADLVNLELNHELSKMSAGPNGSHTLAQWQEAADALKQLRGADPEIETIAQVSGYLDQIEHNPTSLNLTPAQQDLAKKDPATLAFVLAAGVGDLDLSKLSPEMRQIAEQDPRLFALFHLSGIKIWSDDKPNEENTNLGQSNTGLYLHVTIRGKLLLDEGLLGSLLSIYGGIDGDHPTPRLAELLLPLAINENPILQAWTVASDNSCLQHGRAYIEQKLKAPDPDAETLISALNIQLNGFFEPGLRLAFWQDTGAASYFSQDHFRAQFNKLLQRPAPGSDEFLRTMYSTEINADKIGKYMQTILKDAPREIADVLLDTVKSSFNVDWYHSNARDMLDTLPRLEAFYKALSKATELDPGRAEELGEWLQQNRQPQGAVLKQLWHNEIFRFESVKNAIAEGYGATLSDTLSSKLGRQDSAYRNIAPDFKRKLDQGKQQLLLDQAEKVSNRDYTAFIKDPGKAQQTFFQPFFPDNNIGRQTPIENGTQLHNMIGKALGLTPINTKAAGKLDYSVEWYAPNTPEWNAITLATKWIVARGGAGYDRHILGTALPYLYVSKRWGVHNNAMFLIETNPNQHEVIDLSAAVDAVRLNNGEPVDPDKVNLPWHYDNLRAFQEENNLDDEGKIYLPNNLRLPPFSKNGELLAPAEYQEYAAAITTTGAKARKVGVIAAAAVGTAVMIFVPGTSVVGGYILLGTGILGAGLSSGYELYQLNAHGANIGWSNPEARQHWVNIAGHLLALGRLGLLKTVAGKAGALPMFARSAGAVMGMGAKYIGLTQSLTAAGYLIGHWNDPKVSKFDKAAAALDIAAGLALLRAGGLEVNPKGNSPVKGTAAKTAPAKSLVKPVLKWYGVTWGVTNGLGALGWYGANYLMKKERTSGAITDPQHELDELIADPKGYMDKNYEQRLVDEADGHLKAFVDPSKDDRSKDKVQYFHRVPEDLYKMLSEEAEAYSRSVRDNTPASRFQPWVLDPRAKHDVFRRDGKLYCYETIKLSDVGGFSLNNADPMRSDPRLLPDPIKQQISLRAYKLWVRDGRPLENKAADLWLQAERVFRATAGRPAYNAWVQARAKGSTTPTDIYWEQAVATFQKQIEAKADTIWRNAGQPGNGPALLQMDQAEAEFGPQIAMTAYGLWNEDGRQPGMTGQTIWTRAEPTFQARIGLPAFDVWASAGRPNQDTNVVWKNAVEQWNADGKPIMVQTQIRAPYRVEGNVDAGNPNSFQQGDYGIANTPGWRRRGGWAAGSVEGWRMQAKYEWSANYRSNGPTATTLRIGLPTSTQQSWSWDLRQQNTTLWSRFSLSMGTMEYNGPGVYDLTDKSRNSFTVMNARAYLDLGNRDRLRLEGGLIPKQPLQYLHLRETGFAELGLGADFLKMTSGPKTFNINGYYELQWYGPDWRDTVQWGNNGLTNTTGFKSLRTPIGYDLALQFTWSDSIKLVRPTDQSNGPLPLLEEPQR
jgi:Domain of unknown function (DUF4781)/Protein of unknown function (DUF2934)